MKPGRNKKRDTKQKREGGIWRNEGVDNFFVGQSTGKEISPYFFFLYQYLFFKS